MKTKIKYLAYLNLGLGFISFLVGIIPFLVFVSTIIALLTHQVTEVFNSSIFNLFSDGYFAWVLRIDYGIALSGICILLGVLTLVLGFLASISINDKLQRGISFLGNILGTFGIIGNLITLVVILIPKS